MDEKETEIFMEIKEQLGSLNTNMANVLAKLTQHEGRILKLENHEHSKQENPDFKTQLLLWLGKAILIAVTAIATITGSGAMLENIFK